MLSQQPRHPPEVGHGDRLPATRVVRDRHHAERDVLATAFAEEGLKLVEVQVSLERVLVVRVAGPVVDEVHRLGPLVFDVGAGRVEVAVVGDGLARLAEQAAEDLLGGAALVGRDDVAETEDVAHDLLEATEAPRAGITFVADHDRPPLVGAHRAGAAVGQQVNEHVVGVNQEGVEVGATQNLVPLPLAREADRLDRLDPEGLDDLAMHGTRFDALAPDTFASGLCESPDHVVEHRFRQLAGEGVLLARVVRREHGRLARHRDRAVTKLGALLAQETQRLVPGQRA